MSRGYLYDRAVAYENEVISVFCHVLVGASGAVADFEGGAVESVTKETAAGKYTVKLKEKFSRLLGFHGSVAHDAVSGVSQVQLLQQGETLQGDLKGSGEFVIQLASSAATPAAVNAAEDAVIMLELKLRKSSVGPYDKLA